MDKSKNFVIKGFVIENFVTFILIVLLRTLIWRQFELLTLSICFSHKGVYLKVEFVYTLFTF